MNFSPGVRVQYMHPQWRRPQGAAATGTLFEWHCETLDVTTGTPSGSSVNDTTGTASSLAAITGLQFQDGSNSLSIPTTSDYVTFSWDSTTPILNPSSGTLEFYVRFATFADTDLIVFYIDGNNRMRLYFDSANSYLGADYFGNGNVVHGRTNVSVITSLATWYHCKVRWDTSPHSSIYFQATADTTTGEGNAGGFGTDAITTFLGSSGSLNFGDFGGGSGAVFFLDNIKISDTWL